MIIKSLVFGLIAYGFALVIAFLVALIIKAIALIVQRGQRGIVADNSKE